MYFLPSTCFVAKHTKQHQSLGTCNLYLIKGCIKRTQLKILKLHTIRTIVSQDIRKMYAQWKSYMTCVTELFELKLLSLCASTRVSTKNRKSANRHVYINFFVFHIFSRYTNSNCVERNAICNSNREPKKKKQKNKKCVCDDRSKENFICKNVSNAGQACSIITR